MATYQGSTVVKRRPKDGEPGIQGPLMVQKEWIEGDTHRYTDEVREYFYVRGADAAQSYWYTLSTKTIIEDVDAPPTGGADVAGYEKVQWLKELSVQFFIAEEANLANLIFKDQKLISLRGTVNGVAADYSGQANFEPNIIIDGKNGKITAMDGEFHGKVYATDGEFSGTLSGVSGSFKTLTCIDDVGNELGSITFGGDGRIWFENCTLYHQAPSGPFYAADVWVRGVLGSRERTALLIAGIGTTAYAYMYGLNDDDNDYFSLVSKTSQQGDLYFEIPLYSPTTNSSGCPIDLVIINHNVSRIYELQNIPGKTVIVVNSNDHHNDIWVLCNGIKTKIAGGVAAMLVCVGNHQSPDYSERLGRGWFVAGMFDNNWG